MVTERAKCNKLASIAHFVNVLVLVIFSVMSVVIGKTDIVRTVVLAVLGFGPVIAEFVFYRKNPEHAAIKHLVAIGYAVFFTFTLFTSVNSYTFLFVIPMIMVVTVYNDIRYIALVNVGVIIENIVYAALACNTDMFASIQKFDAITQVVAAIFIGVYSTMTTSLLKYNNDVKFATLRESQKNTENVFNEIKELSSNITSGILDIDKGITAVAESSQINADAMKEVNLGANDTANAVQSQIRQTEDIQNIITQVMDASAVIRDNMEKTMDALNEGNNNISVLVQNTAVSVSNGKEVADKLNNLEQLMYEMNSIVGIIGDITSQTSLLSLNASIEAARAGEAGKGFAVVASEISHMATQTQEATDKITALIENVSSAINQVVTVVYQMIDGINQEKQSTESTTNSFAVISESAEEISGSVSNLTYKINNLKEANNIIVDSIQTISAISEQVSAHSNETLEAEEKNSETIAEIQTKIRGLVDILDKEQNEENEMQELYKEDEITE